MLTSSVQTMNTAVASKFMRFIRTNVSKHQKVS